MAWNCSTKFCTFIHRFNVYIQYHLAANNWGNGDMESGLVIHEILIGDTI